MPRECEKNWKFLSFNVFKFCTIMMTYYFNDESAYLRFVWLPFFYHKDTHRIKFSRFYLLWGVRYQHLCDFSHLQKCDNYVITPSNV